MGEVKRLRQENLRLKDQIQALSKEVEQMKLLLQQSSIQLAGEPPTTANATPSREGEKSLSFLSDKHDELILFKTNAMAELERLGKKIEAVNEKVKNISEAIESMENYSYQYNIELVVPFWDPCFFSCILMIYINPQISFNFTCSPMILV